MRFHILIICWFFTVAPGAAVAAEKPWKLMHTYAGGAKYMKPATLSINPDGSGGNVEVMYDLAPPRTIERMGQKLIVKSMITTELFNCTDLSVVRQNPKYYSGDFGTGRELFSEYGFGQPVRLSAEDWNSKGLDIFCQKKKFYEIWK